MEEIVQLNANAKLSEHFTLGEFTRSGSHPEVYNIPSHEAIENMKRLCIWLEELRKRYNDKYVVPHPLSSRPSVARGEISPIGALRQSGQGRRDSSTTLGMTKGGEEPIRLNSGYRSPQLNKKIGGVANSNHLTGCAVDIRTSGMEQAICYAAILINYAKESQHDFDELLIEKNRYGAVWVHFAVRPSNNRRKVMFLNA